MTLKLAQVEPLARSITCHNPTMDKASILTADECRAEGRKCVDYSKKATRPEHRIVFVHMADTWERLAKDMDRHSE